MESDAGTETRVKAAVNYILNPPPPGADPLTFVTEAEEQSTMQTLPGTPVWIHDVRGTETSLDREGFQLFAHTSAVPDLHQIEENAGIDQLYIGEMTALLQRITGASIVIMQGGGKKRYGPAAQDRLANLKNALPALYPHGDTTETSARYLAESIMQYVPGMELGNVKRWAHFNMWRPITPPPQDYPLAVCDARTIGRGDG